MTPISWPARISAWLLFGAVALAPLPFGSSQSIAIAFWCIVLGISLVFAPMRSLSAGQMALVGLAGAVIAAYALVLHEQLADHPWLPGAIPHPVWMEAQAALRVPLAPSVSIARNQPWFELGRPLVCMLAISCGFFVGAEGGRARQLVKVVAWSGAAYATYGVLAHFVDPTYILWREKEAYLDSVTGTFINRNTAGAYFGSCAVVWSLLLWERVRREMPRGPLDWRELSVRLFTIPSEKVGVPFALLLLCLAALFMTGSRGAILLSLFALVVAFVGFFRRDLRSRAGLVATLAGGGTAALVALQLLGSGVNARFDQQGLSDGGRLAAYRATLRMIADHPWFGNGLGTFAYSFPAYRSAKVSVWGVWDMAHNTLLQIAADMGVPIAAVVAAAWIVIFAVLARGAYARRQGRVFPVAALSIGLLAVLHSLIDFSLQIPGYSIVALALIGTGLAQSLPSTSSKVGNKVPLPIHHIHNGG